MADQPVEPGQEGVGRRAPAPVAPINRIAEPGLVARQAVATIGELGAAQRGMRKRIAVAAIDVDLALAEHWRLPQRPMKGNAGPPPSRCLPDQLLDWISVRTRG